MYFYVFINKRSEVKYFDRVDRQTTGTRTNPVGIK
jgi:hypothetical protein